MTWLKNYFGKKFNPSLQRITYEGNLYAVVWIRSADGGDSAYVLVNKRSTENKDRKVVLFEGVADAENYLTMKRVLEEKEKGVPSA